MIKKLQLLFIPLLLVFITYQFYISYNLKKTQPISNKPTTPFQTDFTHEFSLLSEYLKSQNGNYSLYVNDLDNNKIYLHNEKINYYAASLYKVPIGIYALKLIDSGSLKLEDKIIYTPKDATMGTGHINESPYGTEYTIADLLKALFKDSDNTAQTMLSDKFNINSQSFREIFPSKGSTSYYHLNESNVVEIGDYLKQVYTSDILSTTSKKYLFNLMAQTSFDQYLANKVNGNFSHKIGLWGSYIHDCGVILDKNIVVCIMSSSATESKFIESSEKIAEFLNKM